jgi:hypothetical protein
LALRLALQYIFKRLNCCTRLQKPEDHGPAGTTWLSTMARSTLVLVYVMFYEIVGGTAERFICEDGYLEPFPAVPCYTASVSIVVGVLGGLFIVVIPGILAWCVFRNRHNLHNPSVEERIGFLYESYCPEYYWYELSWIVRRVIFSLSAIIPDLQTRVLIISCCVVSAVSLGVMLMPFKNKLENYLDWLGMALIMISLGTLSSGPTSNAVSWILFVLSVNFFFFSN